MPRDATSACLLLLASGSLAACQPDPFPQDRCTIASMGEMPVLTRRFSPIIPVTLEGHQAAMTVDSGAHASLLTGTVADAFGLQRKNLGHMVLGVDGSSFVDTVTINTLGAGSGTIHGITLDVMPDSKARTVDGLPLGGLFGGDFLANYDVYFDLPDRQVALYREYHCPQTTDASTGLGWTQPHDVLAFRDADDSLRDPTKVHVTISLDGTPIDAILDSGAATSLVSNADAARAGVSDASLAAGRAERFTGIVNVAQTAHLHRFASVDIGSEHFTDVALQVADTGVGTLLGADFLRTHRVVVSYQHRQVIIERPDRPGLSAPPAP